MCYYPYVWSLLNFGIFSCRIYRIHDAQAHRQVTKHIY